jgi:hypothetical protein
MQKKKQQELSIRIKNINTVRKACQARKQNSIMNWVWVKPGVKFQKFRSHNVETFTHNTPSLDEYQISETRMKQLVNRIENPSTYQHNRDQKKYFLEISHVSFPPE